MVTSSSSSGPSVVNIILLYLTLIGLGGAGGYGAFYFMFSERCSELMEWTEKQHNASRNHFTKKYEAALQGQRQCMAESPGKKEIAELQGRLDAQASLATQHQALLQQQGEALRTIDELEQAREELEQAREESQNTVNSLNEELDQMEATLQETLAKLEAEQKLSEMAKSESHNKVEKAALIEAQNTASVLEQRIVECDAKLPSLKKQLDSAVGFLRSRSHSQCKMEHGKGPFILQFTLLFPQDDMPEGPNTFDVELFTLSDMPHTIYTLLNLVDLKLFDGTAFVAAADNRIEGGSPNHAASPEMSVKLHERYAKFGYNRNALAYAEYSPKFPHTQHTIGFVGTGPTMMINMADNSSQREGDSCFGKIIAGFDTLERIQKAPTAEDGFRLVQNINIESVRAVRKRNQPAGGGEQQAQQQQQVQ